MIFFILLLLFGSPALSSIFASANKDGSIFKTLEIAFPIIYLAGIFGLTRSLINNGGEIYYFTFLIDKSSLIFLYCTSFIWLGATIYLQRFWSLVSQHDAKNLKVFLSITILLLTFVGVSKNLMMTLFFYSCIILSSQILILKFSKINETKYLKTFNFLLYFETFFFFLAMVFTYKLTGRIDFIEGGIIYDDFGNDEKTLLLIFFGLGLFFSALLPYHVFFRKINFELCSTFIFLFLSYGLVSLFILQKVIIGIFGFSSFRQFFDSSLINIFEIFCLGSVVVSSVALTFSKDLKNIFFNLFFQQIFLALYSVILFGIYDAKMISLVIFSVSLGLSLFFFSASNIEANLIKSGQIDLNGMFHKMPISSSLLIFCLLSFAGIMPTSMIIEKFSLLKIAINERGFVSIALIFTNLISLLFVASKILIKSLKTGVEQGGDFSRDLDQDSRLIMPAILGALLMISGMFLVKII